MMGPTYRADMWAALEQDPNLTAAEIARRAYGSFATAWQVRRDFGLVRGGSISCPQHLQGELRRAQPLH